MRPRNRTPNDLLRALLREARWTNHSFALAVNRVAAETGARLHYDRTSVSHWLAGTRPRPPVPAFAAEALSRRLRRPVPPADTGLVDPAAEDAVQDPASGLGALRRLVGLDLDPRRRAALRDHPFQVGWSAVPPWRERSGGARTPATAGGPEYGPVSALTVMTAAFAAADQAFGGGHARSALVAYLADDVLGRLRPAPAGDVREQLVSAASALTYLVGFMCFDDLHHHLAQHYFRTALHLVDEVGDSVGHSVALRGMSAQACFLGHHRHAARLADAAVDRAGGCAPPGTHAVLLGQAAVAHAALADRRAALDRLAAAERRLERADHASRPPGCTDRADVAHLAGQALALLGEHRQAEDALRASLRHRPEAERRSRLLTTHQLAELHLRRGNPEQACRIWQHFLDECSWVCSGRVRWALDSLWGRLQPFRANAVVHQALRRAERLMDRPSAPPGRTRAATAPRSRR
ncbi:tetratricopeptide repeat protein [Saccharothrix australiensis]|uniref:Tetratricopeptide repeat protein n=1 Tax=Saccharothrix australiensis TaxID=2072 RepID=A0A495VZI7_9PSEU|nr:tetratricopeptide repeat protein [Saccharothrix australiensis]RKT54619.1 hypothetical protein C8E97_3265 [Saccharothrix australiensis]